MLVGSIRDLDLGPVAAVGLGGRHAGLATTAAVRLPPNADVEADELIDSCVSLVDQLDGTPEAAPLDRDGLGGSL